MFKKSCLAILVGASVMLSGCNGSDGAAIESPKSIKMQRHPLTAEDISETYYESRRIQPRIDYAMGEVSYQLADGSPTDVVVVDSKSGSMLVLRPGSVKINVSDTSTVYDDSSTSFTVTVEKGVNTGLWAQSLEIPVNSDDDFFVKARGNKGQVSYRVAEASSRLLSIEASSGKLTPLSVGTATVIIEDLGNGKYESNTIQVEVQIRAVDPSTLSYSNLSIPYSESVLLTPAQLSGKDGTSYQYKIASNSATDIISIDQNSGQMKVNKTGTTKVEVTAMYGENFNQQVQTAFFDVVILPGDRQPISSENQTFSYSADKVIIPHVTNNMSAPTFEVLSGNDVIQIDSVSGYPKIVGVGQAEIKVTDNKNSNYPESSTTFHYTVTKAPHPGLKNNLVIKRVYSDGLTVPLTIEGQHGTLNIVSDSALVSVSDQTLSVSEAGQATLTIRDSGGDHYLTSEPVSVVLEISRAVHPALSVKGLTTEYTQQGCIDVSNYISGNQGQLVLQGNSNSGVVRYEASSGCLSLLKSGSADLTFYSAQSNRYSQSESVVLPVTVNKAGVSLKVSGDVSGTYSDGVSYVASPQITGARGELRFEIAPGSLTDVVEVNPKGGVMKVLNAGTTRINVTDQGSDQYESETVSFNVNVSPTDSRLSATYPTTEYQVGGGIAPSFTHKTDDMDLNFEVISNGMSPVRLRNSKTGEVEIQSGGEYSVKVTALSRNYHPKELTIKGTVTPAAHPGINTTAVDLSFSPLKKHTLQLSQAPIGKRVFAVEPGLAKGIVEIDPNTGELTLLDYTSDVTSFAIIISESGDSNYQPLASTRQIIKVHAPKENVSHRDVSLAPTGTVFSSRLNDYSFKDLRETSVHFSGVDVVKASDEQLNKFGPGINLFVKMKPVGEPNTYLNNKPVLVYVQRFDGCSSEYTVDTVSDGSTKAIAMDGTAVCSTPGSRTQRFLTYTIVDDSHLTSGEWEAVKPFVAYRSSERAYAPTTFGGCYVTSNSSCLPQLEEPSVVHEWNRIDLRLTK